MLLSIFLAFFVGVVAGGLPVVDKGVFVITGVSTCGEGLGYCILGADCTVDKEFDSDSNGHCDGLRKAFTPRAFFVCCRVVNETTTTTTTKKPPETIETIETVESISIESTETTETTETPTTTIPPTLCPPHPPNCHPTAALTRTPSSAKNPASSKTKSDPGSYLCAGALISQDIVLTTATCVSRLFAQDLNQFRVVLNARELQHPTNGLSPGFYREIEEVVIHENYGLKGMLRFNDLGVVRLKKVNESFCPICLHGNDVDVDGCVVSGFSHPIGGKNENSRLHSAPQNLENNCSVAIAAYSSSNVWNEDLICGSGASSAEACFSPRDAGSPLTCNHGNGVFLKGLFSSGFHCGTKTTPVIYTKISNYLPWIQKFL